MGRASGRRRVTECKKTAHAYARKNRFRNVSERNGAVSSRFTSIDKEREKGRPNFGKRRLEIEKKRGSDRSRWGCPAVPGEKRIKKKSTKL